MQAGSSLLLINSDPGPTFQGVFGTQDTLEILMPKYEPLPMAAAPEELIGKQHDKARKTARQGSEWTVRYKY
jgi:hypothetical protein